MTVFMSQNKISPNTENVKSEFCLQCLPLKRRLHKVGTQEGLFTDRSTEKKKKTGRITAENEIQKEMPRVWTKKCESKTIAVSLRTLELEKLST